MEKKPDESELHKLNDNWTLYVRRDERSKVKSWEESIEEICNIDSIEMFWSLYDKIHHPSQLSTGCDIMHFKEGLFPLAENHPHNKGVYIELRVNLKVLISSQNENTVISRKDPRERSFEFLDALWLRLNILLLGCNFPGLDSIVTGFLLQVKGNQQFRFQIWTCTHESEKNQELCSLLNKNMIALMQENGIKSNIQFRINEHRKYTWRLPFNIWCYIRYIIYNIILYALFLKLVILMLLMD